MKGFTKGKGKGRKFIPTSRKKQALSSADLEQKQRKFGISPSGAIGLKSRKTVVLLSDETYDFLEAPDNHVRKYHVSEKDFETLWEDYYETPNEDAEMEYSAGGISDKDYETYFDMDHGETNSWDFYPERIKKLIRGWVSDNIEMGRYDDYFDEQDPTREVNNTQWKTPNTYDVTSSTSR